MMQVTSTNFSARIKEVGETVRIPTEAAEKALRGEPLYEHELLVAALQMASLSTRAVNCQLLTHQQAGTLLQETLKIFEQLPDYLLMRWFTELRDFDACHSIERDFICHERSAKSAAAAHLAKEFLKLLERRIAPCPALAEIQRDMQPQTVAVAE